MTKTRKLLSMVFALVMVFSMMAPMASAATSDPNMVTPYFTYVVDVQNFNQTLALSAQPANSNFAGTSFTTGVFGGVLYTASQAAAHVQWTKVADTTNGGINLSGSTYATTNASGHVVSTQNVVVNANTAPGIASFEAKNTLSNPAGASVNITVVVTDFSNPDSSGTSLSNIRFLLYTPNAGSPTIDTLFNVSADASFDGRSYVTAMDALYTEYDTGSDITHINNIDGFIDTIKIGNVPYQNDYVNMVGWQYRTYTLMKSQSGGTWHLDLDSEIFGAGDMPLMGRGMVVWKYGAFDDPNLFDSVIY